MQVKTTKMKKIQSRCNSWRYTEDDQQTKKLFELSDLEVSDFHQKRMTSSLNPTSLDNHLNRFQSFIVRCFCSHPVWFVHLFIWPYATSGDSKIQGLTKPLYHANRELLAQEALKTEKQPEGCEMRLLKFISSPLKNPVHSNPFIMHFAFYFCFPNMQEFVAGALNANYLRNETMCWSRTCVNLSSESSRENFASRGLRPLIFFHSSSS